MSQRPSSGVDVRAEQSASAAKRKSASGQEHLAITVEFADKLIAAVRATGVENAVAAVAPACWNTGRMLIETESSEAQLLGYGLALEAILRAPTVLTTVVERLCNELVAATPEPRIWARHLPINPDS